jgi:hypothetical protein
MWTNNHLGQAAVKSPDGRIIQIGGEHEDYYDPDFHTYNNVIVCGPDGSDDGDIENEVTIYGYPKNVFPPTDFHTARYYKCPDGKEPVYIIDANGYDKAPILVYRLDLQNDSMQKQDTMGDLPPLADDKSEQIDVPVSLHRIDFFWASALTTVFQNGDFSLWAHNGSKVEQEGDSILYTLADEKTQYKLSIPDLSWSKI